MQIRSLLKLAGATALLALGASAVPARAQTASDTSQNAPVGITRGPDGAIWFTESGANVIGRISTDGKVTTFNLPAPNRGPQLIVGGPDGNLWFTEIAANRIGRITTHGKFKDFKVPTWRDSTASTAQADLGGLAVGLDGNIWFTEGEGNHIGRMTLSGKVTTYSLPVDPLHLGANVPHNAGVIAPGPAKGSAGGVVWFTDNQSGDVGYVTKAGKIKEFTVRSGADSLLGHTAGPDGKMYVTDAKADVVVSVTQDGLMNDIDTSGATAPVGATVGPDGNVWFTELTNDSIGVVRIQASPPNVQEFPLGVAGGQPLFIAAGPDGNLWFTDVGTASIGRITPAGTVKEFPM